MLKYFRRTLAVIGLLLIFVAVLPVTAQETLSEYINTGSSFYYQGDYTQAVAQFDAALEAYPDDSYSYNWRGFIHYLQGDMVQAWADMDRAVALGEDFALVDRAMLYTREGKTALAIVNYERGMLNYPDYAYTAKTAGTGYKPSFEFFVRTYTPVIETYPDDFIALMIRGNAYAHLGEYAKALADYDRVLELAPQFQGARQSRSLVLYKMGFYNCCQP